MCLIIDANVASDFFCNRAVIYQQLLQAVTNGKCCIYFGGQLRREYGKSASILSQVLSLDRAGRAKLIPDADVDALTAVLSGSNACRSDDPHIIALATIAKCRLLCTNDHLLEADFTDARLLAKPRGNVYKSAAHKHLIQKHCRSC